MGIFDDSAIPVIGKRTVEIQLRNFIALLRGFLGEKGDMSLSEALKLLEERLKEVERF